MSYYFSNDTVALVVADENNKPGIEHWSELHEVPAGRLTGGSFSVRASKEDLAWVKSSISTHRGSNTTLKLSAPH